MAFDEIKKVAEAEVAQKAAKEAAIVKGKEEIARANAEVAELMSKTKAEAQEEVRKMVAAAGTEAENKGRSTLSSAQSQYDGQKQSAQNKLSEAAKLITERVVNSQWQS